MVRRDWTFQRPDGEECELVVGGGRRSGCAWVHWRGVGGKEPGLAQVHVELPKLRWKDRPQDPDEAGDRHSCQV